MKRIRTLAGLTLVLLLPALAAAQTTTTGTTSTAAGAPQIPPPQDRWESLPDSHWLASGFVGSTFGDDADEAGFDFGGSIGYLWRGIVGAEFQANFAPEFDFEPARSALLQGDQPWVNSYMVNAIGAFPFGEDGRWQPYVSGGVGAITLRSDVLNIGEDQIEPDDSRAAGNIGFGLLAFARGIGVRGDVRYFGAFEETLSGNETPEDQISTLVLSNLTFWRANIGVAFRW